MFKRWDDELRKRVPNIACYDWFHVWSVWGFCLRCGKDRSPTPQEQLRNGATVVVRHGN